MIQPHAVHLSSVHSPFDIRIFHHEARSLVQAGYRVTIVAPSDGAETRDGIRVRPVPVPRGLRERFTRTLGQVLRAALDEDGDVYHFHDPELLPVGLVLRAYGKRVIYDVHEDVPRQLLDKHWIPPHLRKAASAAAAAAEWLVFPAFNGFVPATPHIAARFPADRSMTVQNFPELAELVAAADKPYATRSPQAVYLGSMSVIRGAVPMVEAAGLMPAGRLVLAGAFHPPALQTRLAELPGWANTEFRGFLNRDGVAELLAESRVGLLVLQPTPSYLESYPVKLFEYMAAGLPVVASDFPLWRSIIEPTGCGLLVDPLDPPAIARAVSWLLEHPAEAEAMGQRGRGAVEAAYRWDHEAAKLVALYAQVLGTAPITPLSASELPAAQA